MKAIDITGQRFGRLTAIRAHSTNGLGTRWLFRCDCGVEVITEAKKRNRLNSCGCLRREKAAEIGRGNSARIADMAGKTFGYLTAVRYVETGPRGAIWQFRCVCGTSLVGVAKDIRYGGRRSCGCMAQSQHSRRELRLAQQSDAFPGLSLERLTEMAAAHGVSGSSDGLQAFACAVRGAALHVDGLPVMLTVMRPEPSGSGLSALVVTES
jgi:hypothetical protein